MTDEAEVSIDMLHVLFVYNSETGELFWRKRPVSMFKSLRDCNAWNTRFAGKMSFSINTYGYLVGPVMGKRISAHRIAYAIHYGAWPVAEIDHINGIRNDNRIVNLRAVDRRENMKNTKQSLRNTSGVTGVHWNATSKRWNARINTATKKHKFLGSFIEFNDAVRARKDAEKHFGYSDRHGGRDAEG